MPSTSYSKPHTDHRTCKWCRARIIFARTAEGKKLPPVNYYPDPVGTMAIHHDPTEGWVGRFLAKAADPVIPEKRHAQHWCGRTLTPARPRRKPQSQPALDLWTST
jgi:hypothetical protein